MRYQVLDSSTDQSYPPHLAHLTHQTYPPIELVLTPSPHTRLRADQAGLTHEITIVQGQGRQGVYAGDRSIYVPV